MSDSQVCKEEATHNVAVHDRPLVNSISSAPANLAPFNINRNEVVRHLLRVRVCPQREEHVGDEGLVAREQDRGGGLLLREAAGEMPRRERAGAEPGKAGVQVEVCADGVVNLSLSRRDSLIKRTRVLEPPSTVFEVNDGHRIARDASSGESAVSTSSPAQHSTYLA